MAKQMAVLVEAGPKGKRFVALARDWPGLERGGKTAEEAVAALTAYLPRYASIAERAGFGEEFAAQERVRVVDRFEGTGSTDFWGISFGKSPTDFAPFSPQALERQLALLSASWAEFDAVARRVSADLAKGPRGGGRDRAQVVRHVLVNEEDWAKMVGVRASERAILTPKGLRTHRSAFLDAIRARHAAGEPARSWPLPYLIRHSAYHTLDHAWEMEDKDLGGRQPARTPRW